jgi:hypothetical protein
MLPIKHTLMAIFAISSVAVALPSGSDSQNAFSEQIDARNIDSAVKLARRGALPPGWIQEWDAKHKAYYYVDTKAVPPRTSWVHPGH